MKEVNIAVIAASYNGNKGAAAMLQSSIKQLYEHYKDALSIQLMSTYPKDDKKLLPFEFIKVVSCKPEELLFVAFPLAIMYFLFHWFPPARWLLLKNKILKSYFQTDLVLDEAGVSFVDSRGFVMNMYAFVSVAVPMLIGVPVIKYSQALGSFRSVSNRMLAKFILPKIRLICARGGNTRQNLEQIGIAQNVKICADGAFTMPDDTRIKEEVATLTQSDSFYKMPFIALSISIVVAAKCEKMKIDYRRVMAEFSDELIKKGYGILLIANAARIDKTTSRNNDLMICDEVFGMIKEKDRVRWYHAEMEPERIRELIGYSQMVIASRFHVMIAGLQRKKPVLLIGWSHKYKEVLDMFGLSTWALDFTNLNLPLLHEKFEHLRLHSEEIENAIVDHLPSVLESSLRNIELVCEIIDREILTLQSKNKLLDFRNPERYIGALLACRKGYAADTQVREHAASGGMVTALLLRLLKDGIIDGAWVSRSYVEDGKLSYKTWIATTEEEIKSSASSIYMEMPLMKHVNILDSFEGRIAAVLLPCQMKALSAYMKKQPDIAKKIVLKICLYCSGSHDAQATLIPLRKKGISIKDANRVIFRRGHGRGMTVIMMKDSSEKLLSYTKTICTFKNAFFFAKKRCLFCQDQFGRESDLSFGDIWLKDMVKNPIKHSSCIIRTERGKHAYDLSVQCDDIKDYRFTPSELIRSQKRSLAFKYNCAPAKLHSYKRLNMSIPLDVNSRCLLRHRLAWRLANANQAFSERHPALLEKIPLGVLNLYMCFLRLLLN